MHRLLIFALFAALMHAAGLAYTAHKKIDSIVEGKAKPGSTVTLTTAECNAWVRERLPALIPDGVRNEYIDFGTDIVSGAALIDVLKIRESLGKRNGLLLTKLLEGERPVKAVVRVVSGGGTASLYVTQVEFSGQAVSGAVLDLLLENVVRIIYPAAKIGEPIELENVERVEVRPMGLRVTMKK